MKLFDDMNKVNDSLEKLKKIIMKGETLGIDVKQNLRPVVFDMLCNKYDEYREEDSVINIREREDGTGEDRGRSVMVSLTPDQHHYIMTMVEIQKLKEILVSKAEEKGHYIDSVRFQIRLVMTSSRVTKFVLETHFSCHKDSEELIKMGSMCIYQDISEYMNTDEEPFYIMGIEKALDHAYDTLKLNGRDAIENSRIRKVKCEIPTISISNEANDRKETKRTNFGIAYGMGMNPQSLAQRIYGPSGIDSASVDKAQSLLSQSLKLPSFKDMEQIAIIDKDIDYHTITASILNNMNGKKRSI